MKPAAAMPMNDPEGLLFPQLRAIAGDLQHLFERVTVSIPVATRRRLPEEVAWLRSEPLFRAVYHTREMAVGEDFLSLYEAAARGAHPDQPLHLCYVDRLSFALQSAHRSQILADLAALTTKDLPLIFARSPAAWQTHPANYFEIEQMVAAAARWRFGRALDYCWCHIVLPAGLLLEIIPTVRRRDMAHVAEYILPIRDQVSVRTVDWLAWEDPFIHGREAQELKREREQDPAETRKRLAYVIPMLQMILESAHV